MSNLQYTPPVSVSVRRSGLNVIEYTVTTHDPISGDSQREFHANRHATFLGKWDGGAFRHQVMGGARSLWRANDNDMAVAFRGYYGGRLVSYGVED